MSHLIKIKVIANSKTESIEKMSNIIKIKVTARAIDGNANKAVIKMLAKKLKLPKSSILIKKGEKSRLKTLIINSEELPLFLKIDEKQTEI